MPTQTSRKQTLRPRLEEILEVARYYGFRDAAKFLPDCLTRNAGASEKARSRPLPPVEGCETNRKFGSLLSACLSYNIFRDAGAPIQLFFSNAPRERSGGNELRLEIFGLEGSLGEALLLRTVSAILAELGAPEVALRVNSLGDRESLDRFLRDATLYYRRNADALMAPCREALKKDIFRVLNCSHERCRALHDAGPASVAYLSEQSRRHFKEVLEFLEEMDMPYEIDRTLVGSGHYTKTVFSFHPRPETDGESEPPVAPALAEGGRYDSLSRRLGLRRDIPALGVAIPIASPLPRRAALAGPRAPRIYFIQIGTAAERKSLVVLELLRRARIRVRHSLGTGRVASELARAEEEGIPYTIIMGHKEALEGTVIVRNTETRAQETVPVPNLPGFLKHSRSAGQLK